jgi:hypothetical protein
MREGARPRHQAKEGQAGFDRLDGELTMSFEMNVFGEDDKVSGERSKVAPLTEYGVRYLMD